MSWPSSKTRPVIQPPSTSSCIRFRVRRKVDLPHPDGPMSACTWFDANDRVAPFTAVVLPYIAVSLSVSMRGLGSATGDLAPSNRQTRADAEEEDDEDQHQRGGPGEPMPLFIRAGRVREDGERQGRHRLVEFEAEILAAERGEQKRSGLAGDPGHREQGPGDDPGYCCSRDHRETG